MSFGKLQLFASLSRRMDWLGDRQRVLAQNVANANTPDYRPQDLKALDFRSLVKPQGAGRLELAATDGGHLGPRTPRSPFAQEHPRGTYETTLSGNAVDLETELQKVAESAMDHQTVSNLYRRHVDMFKAAIGRGGAA